VAPRAYKNERNKSQATGEASDGNKLPGLYPWLRFDKVTREQWIEWYGIDLQQIDRKAAETYLEGEADFFEDFDQEYGDFFDKQDTLEDRVSPNDRPNRLSVSGVGLVPFGRSQKFGSDWNGALDAVLGGWQVSGTYQYQSGFPLTWNSAYYDAACGDPTALVSNIGKTVNGKILGLDVPAWDTSCFYFHDAAVQTNGVDDPVKQRNDQRIQLNNNVRYFPSMLPDVRTHQLHLLDVGLFKNFRAPRGVTLQVRLEWINALNYTVLWNPDTNPRNSTFGYVTQDRNNPRDLQLGVRVTF